MSSRHSVTDCRRSFWDWRRLRRSFRPARFGCCTGGIGPHAKESTVSMNIRLTAQARALLEGGTSHTCLRADPGRSVHQVSFEASLIP
jgi:hypothetical protein